MYPGRCIQVRKLCVGWACSSDRNSGIGVPKISTVITIKRDPKGSLRDLDYELPPKDVDIFIPSNHLTVFEKLNSINRQVKGLETVYNLDIRDPEPFPEQYLEMAEKEDVMEWNRSNRTARKLAESKKRLLNKQPRKIYHLRRASINGYPCDFIFGCHNTCDIRQFDLSFCQISFDGTNIIKTPQYIKTENTGIVTITNKLTYKQERADKFKLKFPDLEFEKFSINT